MFKTSSVMLCPCKVAYRADLIDLISRSHTPPKWGLLGGLNLNCICCLASSVCRVGHNDLNDSWSSLSHPLKFVPWSDSNSEGFPHRDVKRLRAIKNESVSKLLKRSMWTARVVRHLNKMPQCFSLRLPILTVKGPKQSIPVEKNGGLNI